INSSQELAPEEDQGIVLAQTQGAPDATIEQMAVYSDQVYRIARAMPESEALVQLDGQPTLNSGMSGVLLKPWADRTKSARQLQQELQA
ncbi:efflux RND transporter permease subunit, partial [Acinetobacter baumannii]